MSGTPTIVTVIMGRLTGDGTFTGLLPGGVYDRPLKRGEPGDMNGTTPNAWAPTFPYQARAAAVVVDGSDEAEAFGPDGSFSSYPWVYFYAEPHQNGKNTIANAFDQAFSLLHKYGFATGNGTRVQLTVIGRLNTLDDPETTDRVMGGMRLQAIGLWRNTGAA